MATRQRLSSAISPFCPSIIARAHERTVSVSACSAANCAMWMPPSWWWIISRVNSWSSRGRGRRRAACICFGGHAGHLVPRHLHPHPRHRVGTLGALLAPLREVVVHDADLRRLVGDDLARDLAQQRVGAVLEVAEPHGDRLVVVGDHVLEEPDVDGVVTGALGGVAALA